jgi:homospermidine synthase
MEKVLAKVFYENQIIIVGFGSIGQALLPLLFKHLDLKPSQIVIFSKDKDGEQLAQERGIEFNCISITSDNMKSTLEPRLNSGDFLLNMSYGVSSLELIQFSQEQQALYLDLSTEPWEGLYEDPSLPASERTNYILRESILPLKSKKTKTAVVTHGANPGLVSHFVKQALINIAKDNNLSIKKPKTSIEWAQLAQSLGIKVIHVAERDTQISLLKQKPHEFINTWSSEAFIEELKQPAELGFGTHEKHWPDGFFHHESGTKAAIYLNHCGANVKVRSWSPSFGAYHGYLITHAESISLTDYLTIKNDKQVIYRPTVHYAYLPCPAARLSIEELVGTEYKLPTTHKLLMDEIEDGFDELGVLLMGNQKGAYWYGSKLWIHEARKLISNNNATTLQVAAGAISGILWAIANQDRGLVEPDDLDFEYILNIAAPYLGEIKGYYTDWTPLQNRNILYHEKLDWDDPWQFLNIRVS